MDAELKLEDETGGAVKVTDIDGNIHKITVEANGEVNTHGYDAYPTDPAERTPRQQAILNCARREARYTVHEETDHDFIEPNWDINNIERCITAISNLDQDTFEHHFTDYYNELQHPQVRSSPHIATINLILKGIYLDGDSLQDTNGVVYSVERTDGNLEWRGDAGNPQVDVMMTLPEHEFDFGLPRFKDFLINHLHCQIRDIYYIRGETPPEQHQAEGYGMVDVSTENTFSNQELKDLFNL